MFQIYTDGSCLDNTSRINIGGYAFVVIKDNKEIKRYSNIVKNVTNNRMELVGIIDSLIYALSYLGKDSEITVYSDSSYCVDGINTWIINWKKKHYNRKGGLLNTDLWVVFDSLKSNFTNIKFEWIKAHNGHKWNELADELANPLPKDNSLL